MSIDRDLKEKLDALAAKAAIWQPPPTPTPITKPKDQRRARRTKAQTLCATGGAFHAADPEEIIWSAKPANIIEFKKPKGDTP